MGDRRAGFALLMAAACAVSGLAAGCGDVIVDRSGDGSGAVPGGAGGPGGGGGAAGGSAAGGGTGSDVVTLVSGQDTPIPITVDPSGVYWADVWTSSQDNDTAGPILRTGLDGGPILQLGLGPTKPVAVATDETFLYWGCHRGTVSRVSKPVGLPEIIYAPPKGTTGFVSSLVVDGPYLYAATGPQASLLRIDRHSPEDVTVVLTSLWLLDMAIDETDIYWSNPKALFRSSKTDPSPVALYTTDAPDPHYFINGVSGVALDQENVYFADTSAIYSLPKAGGPAKKLTPDLGTQPLKVVADGAWVYWVEPYADRVVKVDKGGGEPVVIAAGSGRPEDLTVSGGFVYWTNALGGTVMKAPK
jgi:hypothetical protein